MWSRSFADPPLISINGIHGKFVSFLLRYHYSVALENGMVGCPCRQGILVIWPLMATSGPPFPLRLTATQPSRIPRQYRRPEMWTIIKTDLQHAAVTGRPREVLNSERAGAFVCWLHRFARLRRCSISQHRFMKTGDRGSGRCLPLISYQMLGLVTP